MPRTNVFMFVILLGLVASFASCGKEAPGRAAVREEGRVFLRNETKIAMGVTYVDEDLGKVNIIVQGGEEKALSRAALEGGTELVVEVEALGTPRPRAEIPVTVDGDVIIRIISFGRFGDNELEYRVQRGGIAGGIGVPTEALSGKDGRIFVRNGTSRTLRAEYFNEELGVIETTIEPGEKKEVSQALLKGGMEVTLTISARGGQLRAKVDVVIDGNVLIRVTGIRAERFLDYEITAG